MGAAETSCGVTSSLTLVESDTGVSDADEAIKPS
jgi:hypothetical protein